MADTIYSAKQFQSGYSGLSHAGIASFLERSFTAAQQTEITNIIKAKEIEICNACGRNFLVDNAVYQEILDGGFNEFEPLNFPIASISKIYIAGQDVTSQFIENTNYFIYDDHIEFDEFLTATENRKAVKIEYKISKFWGDDIVDLIKKMVALEVLSKTEGGVNMAAKSFAEITKNFDLKTFEKQKEDLISSYQVIPV